MIKSRFLFSFLAIVIFCHPVASESNSFEAVKKRLATAGCVSLDFINIIHSEIFDIVDSSYGAACLASDGRYRVSIGDDTYLYDGHNLHSYSKENNQVVIEAVDSDSGIGQEVTFLIQLDELFETGSQSAENSWRLRRRMGVVGDLPDSMIVRINSDRLQIDRLEFYDINEEFNVIEIQNMRLDSICSKTDFVPNFPDSVETIKIR